MSRLISKKNLALLGGVAASAMTSLAVGKFLPAMHGNKINPDHPLVREWLAEKGVKDPDAILRDFLVATYGKTEGEIGSKADLIRQAAMEDGGLLVDNLSGYDIQDLENLTVREVVMRHGSMDGFKRFVESLKNIADYKFRELKIQMQRGELIDRKRTAAAAFALIDVAFSRLVSDVPNTMAQQIVARVEMGGDDVLGEVKEIIRKGNGAALQDLKQSMGQLEFLKDEK